MMKTVSFAMTAFLASIAQALEEHAADYEETIINTISKYAPEGEKFISYEHHLGTPAMHADLEDGKLEIQVLNSLVRTHQTSANIERVILCY